MPDTPKPQEDEDLKTKKKTASSAPLDAEDSPPASPPDSQVEKTDDREPKDELWKMRRQRALADANKPIEVAAEAIWSSDPDKVKARKAIEEAYRKAARKGSVKEAEGELHARYREADKKFLNAAGDMLRSRSGETESRLATWIAAHLRSNSADLPVRTILRERKQVEARLTKLLGPREQARQAAAEKTLVWEKAFARWSTPEKEINAMIGSYADRIDQLNADINTDNNRDQAIFSFWFEVAPFHLQLRPDAVDDGNAPGVKMITDALAPEFDTLLNNYKSGKDRGDGSIFLIDPGPPDQADPPLAAKRREVLNNWQEAAGTQATAEANYAARPDAAADLKPRHDKLRDDGWVKRAREALATPKP